MSKKINLEKVEKLANKNKLNNKQKELVRIHLQDPTQSGYKTAIEAGYSHNTARTNPLARSGVKQTIVDYLRGGSLDSKIQRHYDEALQLSTEDGNTIVDKLSIISTKNQVIKEIHKIAGHYAPTKRDTRTIAITIPSMDDE